LPVHTQSIEKKKNPAEQSPTRTIPPPALGPGIFLNKCGKEKKGKKKRKKRKKKHFNKKG
jgi:hypothetical protein